MNQRILDILNGKPTDRPPVWVMRQAGRYLPEYRAVRQKAGSFQAMIANPEYAAEVTLQPIHRFPLDAAIIFSDILVITEAMGIPYVMEEKKGPVFPEPIRSAEDIQRLHAIDLNGNLKDTITAIRIVKQELTGKLPLIGFAGAPWTIFAYMTEGSGSKTFSIAKTWLYQRPELAHQILQKITNETILYLKAQIQAGADLIQVFDSWASYLSPAMYLQFGVPYLKQIAQSITEVPVILFPRGANYCLAAFEDTKVAIGIDWSLPPSEATRLLPNHVLQGNLDPGVLFADTEKIQIETKAMLTSFQPGKHIANLGHGILPETPIAAMETFLQTIAEWKY